MKERIITARVDSQVGLQIDYLKRHLNVKSTTQILTQAVENFYETIKKQESQKTPFEIMEELGLIGCFEGEENLSQTYKEELTKALLKKHSRSVKRKKKN